MKIVASLPDTGAADVTVDVDDSQFMVDDYAYATVEPHFWSEKAAPDVISLSSYNADGKLLHRLLIRVKGSDGKFQILDRTTGVTPACDMPTEEESTVPMIGKSNEQQT